MPYLRILLACILASLLLITGCASSTPYEIEPISHGTVATDGVRIVFTEGSPFELTSGEAWNPSFHQGEDCLLNPNADNYGDALEAGARKVEVFHPGHPEPLYGVLSLCGRVWGATGPAARSYQLVVPSTYIGQTSGGRVSVVYEYHQYDPDTEKENAFAKAGAKAWILWISRVPLDASTGMGDGKRVADELAPLGLWGIRVRQ